MLRWSLTILLASIVLAAPAQALPPDPVLDALVVGDRQCDRQVMRAPGAAVEELDAELRPGVDASDERVVEHSQARFLEHLPADLGAHVRAGIVPAPRAHHVARSDQLDAARRVLDTIGVTDLFELRVV
jgi:hypothetical protein